MEHPSGFDLRPDRTTKEEPGMGLLLIAAAAIAALASGAAEFLNAIGWGIPSALTILIGIFIGLPLGAATARILRQSKSE